ncbi:hypothetical protein ABZ746_15625 [Streptomyces sp. NPDC020096]
MDVEASAEPAPTGQGLAYGVVVDDADRAGGCHLLGMPLGAVT